MIEIKNLKMLVGARTVSCHETINFDSGQLYFIKGTSGAGKTTLLYILGLISKQKTYQYYYHGQLITTERQKEVLRQREIGFLFQNFNLSKSLTLYQNMCLFAALNGYQISKKEVNDIFEMLRLDLSLERYPESLSGGQKQRFALACLLAKKPKVIIADEPTSALDRENANLMMSILFELAHSLGKTVIVATHTHDYDDLCHSQYLICEDTIEKGENTPSQKALNQNKRITARKMPLSFYTTLLKQRSKYQFRQKRVIKIFAIAMVALCAYMTDYGHHQQALYQDLMSDVVKNEIFVLNAKENLIPAFKELTGVRQAEPVYALNSVAVQIGEAYLPSVEIIGIYDFQKRNINDKGIYVDATLHQYVGKELTVFGSEQSRSWHIENIASNARVELLSTSSGHVIFLSAEDVIEMGGTFRNIFAIEMTRYDVYSRLKEKIEALDSTCQVESLNKNLERIGFGVSINDIYIQKSTQILIFMSFIFFCLIKWHEMLDARHELFEYRVNGLSFKNTVKLLLVEMLLSVIIDWLLSLFVSGLFITIGNLFLIKISMDFRYFLEIFLLILANVIVPSLLSVLFTFGKPLENEMRAFEM